MNLCKNLITSNNSTACRVVKYFLNKEQGRCLQDASLDESCLKDEGTNCHADDKNVLFIADLPRENATNLSAISLGETHLGVDYVAKMFAEV